MFGKISEEWKDVWKVVGFLIAVACLVGGLSTVAIRSCRTVDTAFINYEEFHDLHNAIKAIDNKICNMNKVAADDAGFKYQSKAVQITGLRSLMETRIAEYNSKSSQWHRSLWKSNDIPYRLEASTFSCYPQEIK